MFGYRIDTKCGNCASQHVAKKRIIHGILHVRNVVFIMRLCLYTIKERVRKCERQQRNCALNMWTKTQNTKHTNTNYVVHYAQYIEACAIHWNKKERQRQWAKKHLQTYAVNVRWMYLLMFQFSNEYRRRDEWDRLVWRIFLVGHMV